MKGIVYNNQTIAGTIEKLDNGQYLFRYENNYFKSKDCPPITLTLPKTQQEYRSDSLFPFFSGLLSEGINKDIQCQLFRIDENDEFTRLLLTAQRDTIGAITVEPEDNEMFRVLY